MSAVYERRSPSAILTRAQRHLVLDQSGNVVNGPSLHDPTLGFSVMGEKTLWWCGAAWDSRRIPNVVKDEA